MYGSPGHRPISSAEMTEWIALWKIRDHERRKAEKQAKMKQQLARRTGRRR